MKTIITILFFAVSTFICSAQMQPADSLPGEYVGKYWYANPSTNPWTITTDTVYVTNIDSVNCLVIAADNLNNVGYGNGNYYTDYYSCNGTPPSDYYMKFYNGDSLKWIDDNVPQPPPNQPYSKLFYGKRISNKIAGVNTILLENLFSIYPNPTNGEFMVSSFRFQVSGLEIYNVYGEKIYSISPSGNVSSIEIDISKQSNGIYFLHIKTAQGLANKKIIINH